MNSLVDQSFEQFAINGNLYHKGDFRLEYANLVNRSTGLQIRNKYTEATILPQAVPYTDFLYNDTSSFATLQDASEYISELISLPYGYVSGSIVGIQKLGSDTNQITVALNTSETILLNANLSRKEVKITNDSNQNLLVKYGTGITPSEYTYRLYKKDLVVFDDYDGAVYGKWEASGSGNAVITETIY